MDIYDINLSEITDQYIEFLNQMEQMNLEVTSEFLVMSSTLLYLKSKHLLPKVDEEEEEITEEVSEQEIQEEAEGGVEDERETVEENIY